MINTIRSWFEHISPDISFLAFALVLKTKEHLRLNLSIPVWWLLGATAALLIQSGTLIWQVSKFTTVTERMGRDFLEHVVEDKDMQRQVTNNTAELVRQKEYDTTLTIRADFQSKRTDNLENYVYRNKK